MTPGKFARALFLWLVICFGTAGGLVPFVQQAWAGKSGKSWYQQGEKHRLGRGNNKAGHVQQAITAYQRGCKARHARSCWRLGKMLLASQQPGAREKANAAFRKACRRKLGDGCLALALSLAQNNPQDKKIKKQVARLYRRACRYQSGVGCYQWLQFYEKEFGALQRPSRKRRKRFQQRKRALQRKISALLQSGCQRGLEDDCFYLGYSHYQGILPRDLNKASQAFARSCQLQSANACDFLALMYGNGIGVNRDFTKARSLHQRACNLGLADGCMHVGGMYLRGLGGMKDLFQARQMFQRACRAKRAQGCLLWGEMVIRGEGGSRDIKRAYQIYHKACQLGQQQGCQRHRAMKRILFSPPKQR